jgi:hypothetical protein
MINTKLAKKVLTKQEQKHLTECGIKNMAGLHRQVRLMKQQSTGGIPCFDCKHISVKLGVWV